MIKGYQKRIIFVKDTGSDLFDEAYFILKKDVPSHSAVEDDIVRTATEIINEDSFPKQSRKKKRKFNNFLWFALGCSLGIICCSMFFALLF